MSKQWAVSGNQNYLRDTSAIRPLLRNIVYRLSVNPETGEFFLAELQDKFEFPYKIYNKDESFVDRVEKTYNNTTGNLGILLNGIKGTGKTVTAELICNRLQRPVIIVMENYKGVAAFFNEIPQDVVILYDEFEKIFNKKSKDDGGEDLLSVMDGVLNGVHRKVFLLTTNETNINDNLLQRPSRIRYLKNYGDLDLETIIEIIDDKLTAIEFRDELIKFVSELKLITIDIVKSLVEEVNIHKESPSSFSSFFNVQSLNKRKCVSIVISEGNIRTERVLYSKVNLNIVKFNDECIGQNLQYTRSNDQYSWQLLGKITEVIDATSILINEYDYKGGEDGDGDWKEETIMLKIEDADEYHAVFKNYKNAL